MKSKELKRVFDEAAEIAAGVPEAFRADAFNRAVDALLADKGIPRAGQPQTAGTARAAASADQVLQRSLEVLQLAAGLLGVEAMTIEQIAAALDRRFGLSVSYPRIARALEGSNRLARQAGRGGATLYRLLRPAEAAEAFEEEEEGPPTREETAAAPRVKKRKQAPSPVTSTVRNLVAAGFFTTAHTAGEAALQLQKAGMDVTGRELSAVLRRLEGRGELKRGKPKKGARSYCERDDRNGEPREE